MYAQKKHGSDNLLHHPYQHNDHLLGTVAKYVMASAGHIISSLALSLATPRKKMFVENAQRFTMRQGGVSRLEEVKADYSNLDTQS